MTERYDPRSKFSVWRVGFNQLNKSEQLHTDGKPVFRLCRFHQIFVQPFVLIDQWLQSVIHEVIQFGRYANEMNRTHVERIHQTVRIAWHIESGSIVGEVATTKICI